MLATSPRPRQNRVHLPQPSLRASAAGRCRRCHAFLISTAVAVASRCRCTCAAIAAATVGAARAVVGDPHRARWIGGDLPLPLMAGEPLILPSFVSQPESCTLPSSVSQRAAANLHSSVSQILHPSFVSQIAAPVLHSSARVLQPFLRQSAGLLQPFLRQSAGLLHPSFVSQPMLQPSFVSQPESCTLPSSVSRCCNLPSSVSRCCNLHSSVSRCCTLPSSVSRCCTYLSSATACTTTIYYDLHLRPARFFDCFPRSFGKQPPTGTAYLPSTPPVGLAACPTLALCRRPESRSFRIVDSVLLLLLVFARHQFLSHRLKYATK